MIRFPVRGALAAAMLLHPALAHAADDEDQREIRVVGQRPADDSAQSRQSTDAESIRAQVNATNVEDTLKYLPSLVVRKRHIGDTQSPLATRTTGVGASARSLIYADGALLSALIGNNNTFASPRWQLVSPQEIARVDVLYGPFSAAYPGNSIGAVVNFTTRLPERLEATADAQVSIQQFDQYGTSQTLPSRSIGATLGDRIGRLAFFLSFSHVDSQSQPLSYVTALRPAAASTTGTTASGGYDDLNRLGQPIRVVGASGIEAQRQDFAKLKLALDLPGGVRAIDVGGLFLGETDARAETYLSTATGQAFAGTLNLDGRAYTIPASGYANGIYRGEQRHWSQALTLSGTHGALDWRVIGTLFRFDRDDQRLPATAPPAALAGGSGSIVRLGGTGWATLDARLGWAQGAYRISGGYHFDRATLVNDRFVTSDWIGGAAGALTLSSRGRTETHAVWAEGAWTIAPPVTLTLGGRQEWWRASEGFNFSAAPASSVQQPVVRAARFSPKASLMLRPAARLTLSASWGEAWRFPTVGELYQAVTTGPVITTPNPNLRPERARSLEIAAQYGSGERQLRLALFSEDLVDALVSQSAPLVPGSTQLYTYVQNVDRLFTRGAELSFGWRDLISRLDVQGSVTLIDPRVRANTAFPASIGKRPPQLPTAKATLVTTWRPADGVSLTAALRYASRSFATIDNSDPVANTFQGFSGYTVVDLRALFRVARHWEVAFGVDNVGNDRYFLFHPFPQRSVTAELHWRL